MIQTVRSLALSALICGGCLLLNAADSALNSNDTDFVKKAAKGGTTEVELGRLASQKASDPRVKQFAARIVKDHTAANHQLAALAASKRVDLPSGKGIGGDATYLKLKVLSGKTFDKAYVSAMVDDHKEDVADFEKESNEARDPEVKSFAAKTLPTLRSHLDMIEKLEASYK